MKKLVMFTLMTASVVFAADAASLYQKCATCHGAQGEKKALGKSELLQGQESGKLAESMKAYKAGTLNKNGMGALMKAQMAPIADGDIEALAAHIATLK